MVATTSLAKPTLSSGNGYYQVWYGLCYIIKTDFIPPFLHEGWLMAVQAFMTLALIFSCSAHIASTMLLVRWPLNFSFRYQWQILSTCCLMNGLKCFCLFLSVAIFGGQCWRRDWMLYPNFNYLSWSYAFAVIAMFVGMAATACFYFVRANLSSRSFGRTLLDLITLWIIILQDAKRAMERKKESSNLVVQMQSTHGSQIYIWKKKTLFLSPYLDTIVNLFVFLKDPDFRPLLFLMIKSDTVMQSSCVFILPGTRADWQTARMYSIVGTGIFPSMMSKRDWAISSSYCLTFDKVDENRMALLIQFVYIS